MNCKMTNSELRKIVRSGIRGFIGFSIGYIFYIILYPIFFIRGALVGIIGIFFLLFNKVNYKYLISSCIIFGLGFFFWDIWVLFAFISKQGFSGSISLMQSIINSIGIGFAVIGGLSAAFMQIKRDFNNELRIYLFIVGALSFSVPIFIMNFLLLIPSSPDSGFHTMLLAAFAIGGGLFGGLSGFVLHNRSEVREND